MTILSPGRSEFSERPDEPLKLVAVVEPELPAASDWVAGNRAYDVEIELSRAMTPYEQAVVEQEQYDLEGNFSGQPFIPNGNFLRVQRTTLQRVQSAKGRLVSLVARAEKEGEEHRAAAEAEAGRLSTLAAQITFD